MSACVSALWAPCFIVHALDTSKFNSTCEASWISASTPSLVNQKNASSIWTLQILHSQSVVDVEHEHERARVQSCGHCCSTSWQLASAPSVHRGSSRSGFQT